MRPLAFWGKSVRPIIRCTMAMLAYAVIRTSCIVQNNLYLNRPYPLERGTAEFAVGMGTGLRPVIDSTGVDGTVYYTDELSWAPNLNLSGDIGLTDHFSLGIDMHLPYFIGGFGMNIRPQLTFFPLASDFHLALTGRLGFVASKDSLRLGENFSVDVEGLQTMRGSLNASIALPLGFRMGEDNYLTVTPRLSRTSFAFWTNAEFRDEVERQGYTLAILSLGARLQRIQLEGTIVNYQNRFLPHFGLVYWFPIADAP